MSKTRLGIIYALLTVALWSTLGVGLKLAVAHVGSFAATVYVILFSTVSLLGYLLLVGKARALGAVFRGNPLFFIVTGVIGLGVHQVLYLTGYGLLPASQVIIIHYLWPLTMVVLSIVLFRERTTLASTVFVVIGFLGLCVAVTRGSTLRIDLSAGVVITFLGSFCWALFSVLIKHREFDVDVGMFLFHVFGLAFLAALIPAFGFTFELTGEELLGLVYLGVFPTAISYILWNHALRLARTSLCSNIVLLMPVLSLILIRLILKEDLTAFQLVGFVMILGSVFLNLRYGHAKVASMGPEPRTVDAETRTKEGDHEGT